tara:strand:+ start:200 stop:445 length:246 start_codon:yes stop_codon:yes gene_type:complete
MFTYYTADLILIVEGSYAYRWSFIISRSVIVVIFSLGLVCLTRFIFRRNPMLTKGAFISWWALSVLISLMALMGAMLPAEV